MASTLLADDEAVSELAPVPFEVTSFGAASLSSCSSFALAFQSASAEKNSASKEIDKLFEAPVQIKSQGQAINARNQIHEISPAVLDIDGDGKNELLVGGLSGEIVVFRDNSDGQTADPVWGKGRKFKVEGKTFQIPNW